MILNTQSIIYFIYRICVLSKKGSLRALFPKLSKNMLKRKLDD